LLIAVAFVTAGVSVGMLMLRPSTGDLKVVTSPTGASVFLDDRFGGTAPTVLEDVPVGEHRIRVALGGHLDSEEMVKVERSHQRVDVTLERVPPKGVLIVRSEPPGAVVWLDGERGPETPVRLASVALGRRALKITKAGYVTHEQTVEVAGDKEAVVATKLVPSMVPYYLNAIARNPNDTTNYAELGRIYLLHDEWEPALDVLLRGVMILARKGVSADKGYHELVQTFMRRGMDFSSERWRAFSDSAKKIARSSKTPFRNCRPIFEVLSSFGRWEELMELCTITLPRSGGQAVPLRLWRMEAGLLLKKWDLVAADFDEINRSAVSLKEWGTKYGLWVKPHEYVQTDFAWCGAMSKIHLNDPKGADEVVRRFRQDAPADYWLNSVRAEQWLRDPKNSPPEQFIEAKPCLRAPRVDGEATDPDWRDAHKASEFYKRTTKSPSELRTTVSALYDSQNLYLMIDSREDDPAHIESTVRPGDVDKTMIWRDSSIELFIDANRDYSTYSQFIVNSNGARCDFDCRRGLYTITYFPEPERKVEFFSAARVYPEGWRLELSIPHALLKADPPKAGDAYAVNVIRCRSSSDQQRAYLVPNSPKSHHQPRCFVPIVFR